MSAKKSISLTMTTFGKVIHWESCENFKFNHTNVWYMHNSENVLENDSHLWPDVLTY